MSVNRTLITESRNVLFRGLHCHCSCRASKTA